MLVVVFVFHTVTVAEFGLAGSGVVIVFTGFPPGVSITILVIVFVVVAFLVVCVSCCIIAFDFIAVDVIGVVRLNL